MNMKTISQLGSAPETWSLLPCPLTLDQMKHLRQLQHDELIECRPVLFHLPTLVGMEWRMSPQELKRRRKE